MFRLIKMIDPRAFVSQSSVIGVYGEGFDEMRVKIKKDEKKMKIVFATNNLNKLSEVKKILGNRFEVMSLSEIGCYDDIPEKGQTLKDNALIKAQWIYDKYQVNCFADDTGLEVDALGGAPGVYSARYAGGEGHDSQANMKKLLEELQDTDNRKARFRTVIALIIDGKVTTFEGIVNGEIIREKRGGEGFGYDPIFQPEGYDKTFAELGVNIKNNISHRARAVQKLADYLLKK
jgi:non-canonical purine NTP pyrophosphatase (RdgB/HAM1 family)